MRNITFDYSTDGGSSFATAVTLECKTVRAYLKPSLESQGAESTQMAAAAIECQKATARHYVDIAISENEFNPTISTTATADFIYIQKWACAPIRRIYNADVSTNPSIDGWTSWDTTTNTHYLNMAGDPAIEFRDMDNKGTASRKLRSIVLNCKSRAAVTI